jgi:hypothetical protein
VSGYIYEKRENILKNNQNKKYFKKYKKTHYFCELWMNKIETGTTARPPVPTEALEGGTCRHGSSGWRLAFWARWPSCRQRLACVELLITV